MPIALSAYNVVLALHIMAVLSAFGLPLAYPMLLPYLRRNHPRAMAGVHDAQHRMTQRLVAPATVLVFAFGAYLATKGHDWGKVWVSVPIVIVAIIAVVGGAYMGPRFQRLAVLARTDIAGIAPEAGVVWSPQYEKTYAELMRAEILLGVLVLVAVFFMAAKPFG